MKKQSFSFFIVYSFTLLISVNCTETFAQKAFHKFLIPPAKAFHKGSLLVGITEGNTASVYTTKSTNANSENPVLVKRSYSEGVRDPFFIEYGISDRWGVGLCSGSDIFTIKPNEFYGFSVLSGEPLKVSVNEFTFAGSYHFFVNKRLDLSVFNSLGVFSVNFKGQDNDAKPYHYSANGNIIRVGTKVRYYFFRHLGAMGMLSSYAGHASPKDVKDNTVATNYITNVNGFAIEAGLCYRFFK